PRPGPPLPDLANGHFALPLLGLRRHWFLRRCDDAVAVDAPTSSSSLPARDRVNSFHGPPASGAGDGAGTGAPPRAGAAGGKGRPSRAKKPLAMKMPPGLTTGWYTLPSGQAAAYGAVPALSDVTDSAWSRPTE